LAAGSHNVTGVAAAKRAGTKTHNARAIRGAQEQRTSSSSTANRVATVMPGTDVIRLDWEATGRVLANIAIRKIIYKLINKPTFNEDYIN
jgi:hypothetical protein